MHISADRKTVYGVSLPRDAMVARPECENDDGKTVPGADPVIFNEAFSLAGPTCTVAQVESLTGIYIDHYVTVDFNGFKEMVEAVHGVTVCIPEDVDDSAHGITFEAGTQELDGQQALDYVRERSSTPNADIGRMKRQQAFVASMINKVVSAGTLTKPTRVYSFLKAVTGSVVTDPDLALAEQAGQPGLPVPQDRPRQHHVHHRAVRGVRARPQPAASGPTRRPGSGRSSSRTSRCPRGTSEDVISADQTPGGGSGSASGRTSGSVSGSASGSPASPSTATTEGDDAGGEQEADANGLCA